MSLFRLLKPKHTISDHDIAIGLHWLTLEGTVSPGFNSITTSGFLTAFTLALGARSSGEVVESLPEEILTLDKREEKHDGHCLIWINA